jgi:predicted Zn-dependent protease
MILLAQLSAANDPHKAYELAKNAYQLEPDDAEVCATLGHLAYQNGNDPWAYSLLESASQSQPNNPQVLFDLANAAFSVGKISDAQTAMQSALQNGLSPDQSTRGQNFVDMVTLCQNPAQAMAAQTQIESIMASNPDCVPALFAEAIMESQNQNPAGAEHDYERLLARHPDCTLAQRNLAVLYAQNLVEPDKAFPVALKAREAFPDDPLVAKALACILFQRGDYPRAADLFNSISDSPTADAQLYYYLGISEFHLKNFSDSRNSLQHALNLNLSGPEATDARETLAELR